MSPQPGYVSVLLDTPLPQLDHIFEYRIPESLHGQIVVGSKVSVPLRGGSRFCDAYVTALNSKPEFAGELLSVEKVISALPILLPDTLALARKVADRQAGSVIDVLRLAIPARYVRAEKAFLVSEATEQKGSPHTVIKPTEFKDYAPAAAGKYALKVPPRLVTATDGQSLPNWVQLFVALAHEQFQGGKSSVLALPDFRDIELIEAAFHSAGLSEYVIRVDAKLSGQDRYLNYLRSTRDEPLIIVGNRSAILAPAHNLGLILMWDDGDHNFEEPLAPYAHARDVALVRQSHENCALLFASHSRSLEVQRLVELNYLSEVQVAEVEQPHVVLTDAHVDEGETSSRIPSAAWLGAKKALDNGPVLVQVASPGFAPALVCSECRERATCTTCHGPIQLAHKSAVPSCRWCGQMNATWKCASCGHQHYRPVAAGTERTSDEIGRAFPGVKVIVADGNHIITTVPAEPAVIVSTPGAEPLAQGGYSAILLLDGERLRGREAFRVDEDVLRNWSNTISLAQSTATVYINGAGASLGAALRDSEQVRWAANELNERLAFRLPPTVRVVSVTGPVDAVRATCDDVPLTGSYRLLGPVGQPDGSARALIFFEYKDGEALATYLRSCIITSATRSKKPVSPAERGARVLRLRVRFDDPDIDSL